MHVRFIANWGHLSFAPAMLDLGFMRLSAGDCSGGSGSYPDLRRSSASLLQAGHARVASRALLRELTFIVNVVSLAIPRHIAPKGWLGSVLSSRESPRAPGRLSGVRSMPPTRTGLLVGGLGAQRSATMAVRVGPLIGGNNDQIDGQCRLSLRRQRPCRPRRFMRR